MSVSPVHPDPACPACRGTGRVARAGEAPCGRCKARECRRCDAVLPAHEPWCEAGRAATLTDAELLEEARVALDKDGCPVHAAAIAHLAAVARAVAAYAAARRAREAHDEAPQPRWEADAAGHAAWYRDEERLRAAERTAWDALNGLVQADAPPEPETPHG